MTEICRLPRSGIYQAAGTLTGGCVFSRTLLAKFFSRIAAFDEARAFAADEVPKMNGAAEPRLDDHESHKRLFLMFEAFLVGQIEGVF